MTRVRSGNMWNQMNNTKLDSKVSLYTLFRLTNSIQITIALTFKVKVIGQKSGSRGSNFGS